MICLAFNKTRWHVDWGTLGRKTFTCFQLDWFLARTTLWPLFNRRNNQKDMQLLCKGQGKLKCFPQGNKWTKYICSLIRICIVTSLITKKPQVGMTWDMKIWLWRGKWWFCVNSTVLTKGHQTGEWPRVSERYLSRWNISQEINMKQ